MIKIFKTIRPLQSKRVREILQDKDSREKFLDAIYTMKDDDVSKTFVNRGKKTTIKRVVRISQKT
jgi:hypothetical protein